MEGKKTLCTFNDKISKIGKEQNSKIVKNDKKSTKPKNKTKKEHNKKESNEQKDNIEPQKKEKKIKKEPKKKEVREPKEKNLEDIKNEDNEINQLESNNELNNKETVQKELNNSSIDENNVNKDLSNINNNIKGNETDLILDNNIEENKDIVEEANEAKEQNESIDQYIQHIKDQKESEEPKNEQIEPVEQIDQIEQVEQIDNSQKSTEINQLSNPTQNLNPNVNPNPNLPNQIPQKRPLKKIFTHPGIHSSLYYYNNQYNPTQIQTLHPYHISKEDSTPLTTRSTRTKLTKIFDAQPPNSTPLITDNFTINKLISAKDNCNRLFRINDYKKLVHRCVNSIVNHNIQCDNKTSKIIREKNKKNSIREFDVMPILMIMKEKIEYILNKKTNEVDTLPKKMSFYFLICEFGLVPEIIYNEQKVDLEGFEKDIDIEVIGGLKGEERTRAVYNLIDNYSESLVLINFLCWRINQLYGELMEGRKKGKKKNKNG